MSNSGQAPKQGRGERRRALIVEAATEAFLERGYGGASLDDIVRQAGGSRRDIYAWFGNKEGLFAAVISQELEGVFAALDAAGASGPDLREALIRLGTDFVSVLVSERVLALYRVVVGESARFPELGRAFYEAGPAQAYARLASDLERAAARGHVRVEDPALTARLMLEMVKGDLQIRALFDDSVRPSEQEISACVRFAVDILLDGIGVG